MFLSYNYILCRYEQCSEPDHPLRHDSGYPPAQPYRDSERSRDTDMNRPMMCIAGDRGYVPPDTVNVCTRQCRIVTKVKTNNKASVQIFFLIFSAPKDIVSYTESGAESAERIRQDLSG